MASIPPPDDPAPRKGKPPQPRTKKGKLVGRRRKILDMAYVRNLAKIGCTHEEIADSLGITVETLTKHPQFLDNYKMGLSNCKISVRRSQVRGCRQGNGTAMVWVGKQLLGQRDRPLDEVMATAAKEVVYRWATPADLGRPPLIPPQAAPELPVEPPPVDLAPEPIEPESDAPDAADDTPEPGVCA